MKNIILVIIVLISLSCNKQLDNVESHNTTEAVELFSSPAGYARAMEGVYSLSMAIVDNLVFTGEAHGNNMKKMELALTGQQADVFNFDHTDRIETNLNYSKGIWSTSYKMILNINYILDNVKAEETNETILQAKAEALFMRAFSFFNLVRLYGMPYYQNPEENLGVVLPLASSVEAQLPRSTVKETYEQIIKDLTESIPLFKKNRGSSYASKEAAQALLSRVYLYMGGTFSSPDTENNLKVIEFATEVLNSPNFSSLQGDAFRQYYTLQNTANSEDIFATNTLNTSTGTFSNLAGYFNPPTATTGGTYAASPELLELVPVSDLRHSHYTRATFTGGTADDSLASAKYVISRSSLASKSPARHIRRAEMFLNRAEAYVKLGEDEKALSDVNEIRTRANLTPLSGIGGQALFNEILRQRRIELAFEGHIGYDYFRNGLAMTRTYTSNASTVTTIQATSPKILLRIPIDEIKLNTNLKQNDQ